MSDAFDVVRMFEYALCDYTGARYCVATTSCTMALLITLKVMAMEEGATRISIPRRTYVGVPQSVINAGHLLTFDSREWIGRYQLSGSPVVDSARLLTSGMYQRGTFTCLSFHWTKHLAIGQGGAILHDNRGYDEILRRMRFDGRAEGVPAAKDFGVIKGGMHAYMMPRDAAEGLTRLKLLPQHNMALPNSDYPDLSKLEAFK